VRPCVSEPHYENVAQLVDRLLRRSHQRPAVFVIGAGASYPYPGAYQIKKRIVESALRTCHSVESTEFERLQKALLNERKGVVWENYLTLETLFFLCQYALDPPGSDSEYFKPEPIIHRFLTGLPSSPGNLAVAYLRKLGHVGQVLTSNFDNLLCRTLDELEHPYRLLTDAQFEAPQGRGLSPLEDHLLAFHGTMVRPEDAKCDRREAWESHKKLTHPRTLLARGLMRPFTPEVRQYVEAVLRLSQDRDVVFFGYSGSDFYDLNLVLRTVQSAKKLRLDNIHWISFDGKQESLSSFARELKCRYYKGDFARALLDELRLDGKELARLGIRLRFVESARQESRYEIEADFAPADDNLFLSHTSDEEFRRRASHFLRYLESGFAGAWAVTEHYSLESYGFSQLEIRALGGLGKDSIDFLGVNARGYLDAQERYWEQNPGSRDRASKLIDSDPSISPQAIVDHVFPGLREIFQSLYEATVACLSSLERSGSVLPAELAMIHVLTSITLDYQGLMFNIVRETSSGERQQEAARQAVALFEAAVQNTRTAREILSRDTMPEEKALRDLVPYLTWTLIAEENRARALPDTDMEQKLSAFEACIKRRRDIIERAEKAGLREEAIYLLPQTVLRCTEAFKVLYGCSRAQDLPTRQDLDGSQAATFLQIAYEMRTKYEEKSAIPNHRFVTIFDCEIIDALHKRNFDKLSRIMEELFQSVPVAWHTVPRFPQFLGDVRKRLEAAVNYYGCQRIREVLELFDRLGDSGS
jgi:hypothetical protein